MKTAAVIAEYNPFHNGHAYQLREIRRLTGADAIVVAMSGDFVQRGEPALVNKHVRTQMALLGGADAVYELPVRFATGSAEYFARGAVHLIAGLGCVDYLCFGAECDDLPLLQAIASLLNEEPDDYRSVLQNALKQGLSYPAARQEAVLAALRSDTLTGSELSCDEQELRLILSSPNNILAIEYLKALERLPQGSTPQPVLIRRVGSGYHETALQTGYASATAVRSYLQQESARYSDLRSWIPDASAEVLIQTLKQVPSLTSDDLSAMLHYRLLMGGGWKDYASCFDVPEALARRIERLQPSYTDFDTFVQELKTKNITELTIQRALLHLLLQLPKNTSDSTVSFEDALYGRLLGFRTASSDLLARIRRSAVIPLITKFADAEDILQHFEDHTDLQKTSALQLLYETKKATALYHAVTLQLLSDAEPAYIEEKQPVIRI
ncbi:MAG: nucleotidyltransferase family protein [Eubacteriales bacterium]|nr:nucleotidyltransferase family protein [Eubacteriales bacterium]